MILRKLYADMVEGMGSGGTICSGLSTNAGDFFYFSYNLLMVSVCRAFEQASSLEGFV
jgi:hypothetical protein